MIACGSAVATVAASVSASDDAVATAEEEALNFRVVWKKQTFEVSFGAEQRVSKLKEHIQTLTGVALARGSCTRRTVSP